MSARESTRKRIAAIRVGSHLDRNGVAQMDQLIHKLMNRGYTRLTIDFHATEHIYFRTAYLLEKMREELRKQGGDLICVGASEYVSNILLVMGFLPQHGKWSDYTYQVPPNLDSPMWAA